MKSIANASHNRSLSEFQQVRTSSVTSPMWILATTWCILLTSNFTLPWVQEIIIIIIIFFSCEWGKLCCKTAATRRDAPSLAFSLGFTGMFIFFFSTGLWIQGNVTGTRPLKSKLSKAVGKRLRSIKAFYGELHEQESKLKIRWLKAATLWLIASNMVESYSENLRWWIVFLLVRGFRVENVARLLQVGTSSISPKGTKCLAKITVDFGSQQRNGTEVNKAPLTNSPLRWGCPIFVSLLISGHSTAFCSLNRVP